MPSDCTIRPAPRKIPPSEYMDAMTFDFNTLPDRRHSNSLKWNGMDALFGAIPDDTIPMWVADMDIPSPPAVQKALLQLAQHGIYGYPIEDTVQTCAATRAWVQRRHNWYVHPEHMLPTPGVIPTISILIQELSKPNEAVVVQPPVYPPLFHLIKNAGRTVALNPLLAPDSEHPSYRMNVAHLEQLFREGARLFILCSPHNPTGRVWTPTELQELLDICIRYDVTVIADEIHNDFIMPGYKHTVFATLSDAAQERTYTCISASKTFNLGGIPYAQLVTPHQQAASRILKALQHRGLSHGDVFGITATQAAHTHGDAWVDALIKHIADNNSYVQRALKEYIPCITMPPLEGTYLPWLNCRALGLDDATLMQRTIQQGVLLSNGTFFGEGGSGHLRLNLATSRARLATGVARLIQALCST